MLTLVVKYIRIKSIEDLNIYFTHLHILLLCKISESKTVMLFKSKQKLKACSCEVVIEPVNLQHLQEVWTHQ